MQDVARREFDRLEVRREQFEILVGELPEQIVRGPTGHSFFSGLAGNRRQPEPYVSAAEPTVPKCTQAAVHS
ncbi:hypothetical protein BwSH20_56320 [Bradyrhizobium ottawaense]|nr:hypothetical protein SG09_51820 [Bradyrhizobium ottawaense]BBO13023.1 hypothetical protein TM102_44930 [Bradyrhizobium sp. TM102]GMO22648.1 hypothetical protein BwSF12_15010 [Bradyrhizobium ottawaense]GMO44140.1 hypothetical protein BwSF21_58440 [Bradyrhizobium ottawaense]GMO48062.1 hypothetical protein BwSH14_66330 [Bradyrhizobium ottawaense]